VLAIGLALGSSLVYGVSDFLGGLKSRSTSLLSVLLVSQGAALLMLAVIVAAIALGELPEPVQGAGIAVALAGVAVISLQPDSGEESRDVGASVMYGALTALGFGSFLVAMDAASEGSVEWALLVARLAAVTAFATVFLVRRPALGVRPAELPVLALIGALIIGADAMFAVASTEGLLSVVAVLSSLYPVVTIVLARIYLRERIARRQQLGAAAALAGAIAISAA
jgi:drug/metabolite transporter (DMT)-like permease